MHTVHHAPAQHMTNTRYICTHNQPCLIFYILNGMAVPLLRVSLSRKDQRLDNITNMHKEMQRTVTSSFSQHYCTTSMLLYPPRVIKIMLFSVLILLCMAIAC